jgi:RNA recognition motif-containing protein
VIVGKRLYVGNLPYTMTEQELRELFAEHGSVDAVDVIMDRETGRPRGFAFVEMDNAEAAIEALNGREIGGRTMRVDEANERPRR